MRLWLLAAVAIDGTAGACEDDIPNAMLNVIVLANNVDGINECSGALNLIKSISTFSIEGLNLPPPAATICGWDLAKFKDEMETFTTEMMKHPATGTLITQASQWTYPAGFSGTNTGADICAATCKTHGVMATRGCSPSPAPSPPPSAAPSPAANSPPLLQSLAGAQAAGGPGDGANVGAIIGGVVGGVVALGLIALAAVFFIRSRARTPKPEQFSSIEAATKS